MYLYYETHKDSNGIIVLTEMRISSKGDGQLFINFSNPTENILFELCKTILKWPSLDQRNYDELNKVWSYFGVYGAQVIAKLKETTRPIQEIQCIEVEDLAAQALNNRVTFGPKGKRLKAEDFFYNHGQPVSTPALTRETVAEQLKKLMGETLDKSAYRKAALKFHPDRNAGDGSKMSELNSLWSVYNA